jgi:hypothetical protein
MVWVLLGLVMLGIGGVLFAFDKLERYWKTNSTNRIKLLSKSIGMGLAELVLIILTMVAISALVLFIASIH